MKRLITQKPSDKQHILHDDDVEDFLLEHATGGGEGLSFGQAEHTVYKQDVKSKVQPIQIMDMNKQFLVIFTVNHTIPKEEHGGKGHNFHFFKGPEDNKQVHSKLQLQFTKTEDHWYLNLLCDEYTDLFKFDLTQLMHLFPEQHHSALIERSESVNVEKRFLNRKIVVTAEAVNDNTLNQLFDQIRTYQTDCLGRYKVLVKNTDMVTVLEQTIALLNAVISDYSKVTEEQYATILKNIQTIETSEAFESDVIIQLSYESINPALERLKAGIRKEKGVQLDNDTMHQLLDELAKHEGHQAGVNKWMPSHSMQNIRDAFKKHMSVNNDVNFTM